LRHLGKQEEPKWKMQLMRESLGGNGVGFEALGRTLNPF
jgi:hypothetical protein